MATLQDHFQRFWRRTITEPLHRIDKESRVFLDSDAARQADYKVITVLVTTAVCLTLLRYFGGDGGCDRVVRFCHGLGLNQLAEDLYSTFEESPSKRINVLTHWTVLCVVCYFIVPAALIQFGFREPLRDYGVKLRGAFTDFWLYALMFAIVGPLVYLVSTDAHFQETYPFYHLHPDEALWPNFWRWELQYAVQFFALEFFFRGFLLHGTKHRFGVYAIFVMMVPYCMIHFGKPMPEACASIIAGIALGFMSLKNRSIWLGAAIHVTVALSMDLTSIWRKGYFG
jgi:membrane protease YdiL (CAAX protease family)